MADIIHPNLPADLPTDWNMAQYVSPNGTEVGLSEKHGYNYLMRQLNDTQTALNTLAQQTGQAVAGLEEGEYNATATRTGTTVAITGPDGAKAVTFLAPADWTEGDGYTYNGAEVALSDLNGGAVANAWTAGAPVTFYLTEGRAYFAAGASQLSPQEILDKLKTVDGAGSGLDADLLDGKQASEFAQLGTDGKIPVEQVPVIVGTKIEATGTPYIYRQTLVETKKEDGTVYISGTQVKILGNASTGLGKIVGIMTEGLNDILAIMFVKPDTLIGQQEYVNVRGADPKQDQDLTTKKYVDSNFPKASEVRTIEVVNTLPASPVATTLYLVKE
nr:MAG TPA: hypothetical protein [Caudoviricetes sp.]